MQHTLHTYQLLLVADIERGTPRAYVEVGLHSASALLDDAEGFGGILALRGDDDLGRMCMSMYYARFTQQAMKVDRILYLFA